MKNEYEVRGDVTAIIINSKKHGKVETIISTRNLKRACEITGSWCLIYSKSNNSLYVYTNLYSEMSHVVGGRKKISLHRWLTEATNGYMVDHINHDTLDNTTSNLRICSNSENAQNRKSANTSSKSGVRGVSWSKTHKKWRVQVRVIDCVYTGFFESLSDAEGMAVKVRAEMMPFSSEGRTNNKNTVKNGEK